MKKVFLFIVLLFLLALSIYAQTSPHRVTGSLYPASLVPDTVFATSETLTESQRFTIMTLQGLLAKTKPAVIRQTGIWINDLRNNYNLIVANTYLNDFQGLLSHFKSRISGYVLCNLRDTSSNVAISLCGILNAIAVTSDNVAVMNSVGIPQLYDVRGRNEAWALSTFGSQLSTTVVSYQSDLDNRVFCVGDYSVFANALSFWEPANHAITTAAFNRMRPNAIVMGYPQDEYNGVTALSQRSLVLHPSDWAVNLSVYTNFSIQQFQQKPPPAPFSLRNNVHTVCFVMTDGDNIQWLVNGPADQRLLGSPNRSTINLGWTISPALSEIAPTIMKYYYDNAPASAAGRSYFIAGPSGRGYNFPDLFGAIDTECTMLDRYMAKADLRIVNILDVDNSRKNVEPFLRQPNIDAVFFYSYGSYYVQYGSTIFWSHNKPAVTGRDALWGGHSTTSSVAALINAQSTDIRTAGAYSLIPVHVWSMSVDSVIACISKLGPQVRVVPPDEFVWLIQHALATGIYDISPSATESFVYSFRKGVLYLRVPHGYAGAANVRVSLYSLNGALLTAVVAGTMKAGMQTVDIFRNSPIKNKLTAGMYLLRIAAGTYQQNEKVLIP